MRIISDIVYDPSLVLYLPLYELDGTQFASKDAYGHLATVTTPALWTFTGREFDGGLTGELTITDATGIQDIFDNGGTVECWINVDSDGENNAGRMVHKLWNFHTREEASGKVKLQFQALFSGDNGKWTTTATEVAINNWACVAATYNNGATGNAATIYVNGNSVATTVTLPPTGARTTDVGTDLYIGNNSGSGACFDGTIGEIRLYTRILSPQEIQNHYLATKWRYQ